MSESFVTPVLSERRYPGFGPAESAKRNYPESEPLGLKGCLPGIAATIVVVIAAISAVIYERKNMLESLGNQPTMSVPAQNHERR